MDPERRRRDLWSDDASLHLALAVATYVFRVEGLVGQMEGTVPAYYPDDIREEAQEAARAMAHTITATFVEEWDRVDLDPDTPLIAPNVLAGPTEHSAGSAPQTPRRSNPSYRSYVFYRSDCRSQPRILPRSQGARGEPLGSFLLRLTSKR